VVARVAATLFDKKFDSVISLEVRLLPVVIPDMLFVKYKKLK
jgi:hypothetical protein